MSLNKVSIIVFIVVFWLALPIGFSLADIGGYTPLTTSDNIVTMLGNAITLDIYILPKWAKVFIWVFRIMSILSLYLLLREG